MLDSYLKGGWAYILAIGAWTWAFWLVPVPVCAVGIRSQKKSHHTWMAVAFLVWQVAVGFETLPTLGF